MKKCFFVYLPSPLQSDGLYTFYPIVNDCCCMLRISNYMSHRKTSRCTRNHDKAFMPPHDQRMDFRSPCAAVSVVRDCSSVTAPECAATPCVDSINNGRTLNDCIICVNYSESALYVADSVGCKKNKGSSVVRE